MRQLLPAAVADLTVDQLAELFAYRGDARIRANMVSSLDGAVAVDGRSAPISGPPDKYMFGFLRALADVVVVGAGTVRSEGYGPGRVREEFAHLRLAADQLDAPVIAVVTEVLGSGSDESNCLPRLGTAVWSSPAPAHPPIGEKR